MSCRVSLHSSDNAPPVATVVRFTKAISFCEFAQINRLPDRFEIKLLTLIGAKHRTPLGTLNLVTLRDIQGDDPFAARGQPFRFSETTIVSELGGSPFCVFFALPGRRELFGPLPDRALVRDFCVPGFETSFFLIPEDESADPIFFYESGCPPLFFGAVKRSRIQSTLKSEYEYLSVDKVTFSDSVPIGVGSILLGQCRDRICLRVDDTVKFMPPGASFNEVLAAFGIDRARGGLVGSNDRVLTPEGWPTAGTLARAGNLRQVTIQGAFHNSLAGLFVVVRVERVDKWGDLQRELVACAPGLTLGGLIPGFGRTWICVGVDNHIREKSEVVSSEVGVYSISAPILTDRPNNLTEKNWEWAVQVNVMDLGRSLFVNIRKGTTARSIAASIKVGDVAGWIVRIAIGGREAEVPAETELGPAIREWYEDWNVSGRPVIEFVRPIPSK
jgi:hypothetical protein